MSNLELEVKVLNLNLIEIEKKLIDLGAILLTKEEQINTIFDDENSSIQKNKDAYLRIREKKSLIDGSKSTILTYKKNIPNEDLRENIELNIDINEKDKNSLIKLLDELGYKVVNIGYKHRISYILDDIKFDLDKWDKDTYPYPYMEIEVKNKDDLNRAVSLLDLDFKDITTDSIVDLKNKL